MDKRARSWPVRALVVCRSPGVASHCWWRERRPYEQDAFDVLVELDARERPQGVPSYDEDTCVKYVAGLGDPVLARSSKFTGSLSAYSHVGSGAAPNGVFHNPCRGRVRGAWG
jgi:hypothetical protein